MKIKNIIIIFFFAAMGLGCNVSKLIVNTASNSFDSAKLSIRKNGDLELLRDAIPASLLAIDVMLEASPDNKKLLITASEAYFGYSFAFVENKNPERARKLYKKAKGYAERAIIKKADFSKISIDQLESNLKKLKKEDVPALFQLANSWIGLINLSTTNIEALADIPKVIGIIERMLELNPDYYFGSPHVLMAGYYSARSKALGGNPEKAKYHFDKAFEISKSKSLLFHLFYAKYYAVQIQDKELFIKTLKYIIAAPDDLLPEMNFLNAIAKQKAKGLLENADEYF
ncbi:MAG: hypothetical protein HQK79_05915 [Desulfobacterales bacterium]|nr:hypothetical protein [Desulfobacterales bacterium]MBF0396042.1 hypothetical protein [Desulfobacterales bacterium]